MYERLFTYEATARISAFLGVPHLPPELEKGVNTAPKAAPISEKTARRVAGAYAEVYRLAVERFGRDVIAGLWPHLEQAESGSRRARRRRTSYRWFESDGGSGDGGVFPMV